MTNWAKVPVPLSRNTMIAFMRAEAGELREARAREQAKYEAQERAEALARAYFAEHGEYEWQTRQRERDILARAEQREYEKRQREAAERQQAQHAALVASGRQPRTVAEILAMAALYP